MAQGTEKRDESAVEAALARVLRLRSPCLRPRYVTQSAWVEHIPFGFWLMEAHRPAKVVELGMHYGVSYFAFCQAAEHLSLGTSFYGVDTWTGDEQAGFYGPEVFRAVKRQNQQYSASSQLIRSSFDEALPYFPDGSVDLLHIDGLHTREAVEHDFTSWLPKLSPRALVLFHDTNMRERGFGVWSFLHELRGRYPVFEFFHGHGLGVVGVGAEQTQLLQDLFVIETDSSAKEALISGFAQLGYGCLNMQRKGQLEGLLRQERALVTGLREEVAGLQARIGALNTAVTDNADAALAAGMNESQRREVEELRQRLNELVQSESQLLSRHDADQARIAQLEGNLKDRFREVSTLSARLMAKGMA